MIPEKLPHPALLLQSVFFQFVFSQVVFCVFL